MSSTVVSKNLYELLGNTHDEDSDKEPEPPVKVVDKTPARTTKRNAPAEAPASKAPVEGRSNNRRGPGGNEGAFRDRQAGSSNNRTKPTEDGSARPERRTGTYEGRGRGRGGRGARGGRDDRHSRTVGGDSEKQAAHGWGATEGDAEQADEQAGEAIAKADAKDVEVEAIEAAEPEPEDNSISYTDYLVQLAEKKLALGSGPEVRKANEGSKQDKKWASAKALEKEEEESFIAGSGGKAKRERERKQKQLLEIDQRFVEAPEQRTGGRGGREGGRGGRGRGDGPRRGGDGPRGGARRGDGPRGGAQRGAPRQSGPRAPAASINTSDESAFPSLGA